MDAPSLAYNGAELVDIAKKIASSPGSELKSIGPQGIPDAELVLAFEAHMQADTPIPTEHMVEQHHNTPSGYDVDNNVSTTKTDEAYEAFSVEKSQTYDENYARKELDAHLQSIGQGELSAEQLFRLQYLTNMFGFSIKAGNSITQNAAREMDVLLKQQG